MGVEGLRKFNKSTKEESRANNDSMPSINPSPNPRVMLRSVPREKEGERERLFFLIFANNLILGLLEGESLIRCLYDPYHTTENVCRVDFRYV